MWQVHSLVTPGPISQSSPEVLEEAETYRIVRAPLGATLKHSKVGSPIPQRIGQAPALTRDS